MEKAKVIENKKLTEDVFELFLEPESKFVFEAGQFITIKINDGLPSACFRAYSIASSPQEKLLQICIKVIKKGRGSNWLHSLKPGDEIEFFGPNGNFIFKTPKEKKVLFIATGTGIAPLKSIIEEQLGKGNKQSIHLLFGLRYIKDTIYEDTFEKLTQNHKNFKFDITLSQPDNEKWKGLKGRVTDHITKMDLNPENTEVYLCGLNAMIESVTKILKEKGFKKDTIHFEKYD